MKMAKANSRFVQSAPSSPAGGLISGCAAPLLALIASWRRRKPQHHVIYTSVGKGMEIHLRQVRSFSLQELQVATENFSDENILGRSRFGNVYKGTLADGSLVVVKRLKENYTEVEELQFQTEVDMIGKAVHGNLLRLCGFCMTPTEKLLVYPFMVNGSVASWLRVKGRPKTKPPLIWEARKRIALGVARGLVYLHEQCESKIIHRDVKAANILLDEELEGVVANFELVKFVNHKNISGEILEKTDVLGYGVMLMDLITGQRASNIGNFQVKRLLKEKLLFTLVDDDLGTNYDKKEAEQLLQVALLCTQRDPKERPKMVEVLRMLEGDGSAMRWKEWQKEEICRLEAASSYPHCTQLTLDSTCKLHPEELSGPR